MDGDIGSLLNRNPRLAQALTQHLATAPEPAGWQGLARALNPHYPAIDGSVIRRYTVLNNSYTATEQLLSLCGAQVVTIAHFDAALGESHNSAARGVLRQELKVPTPAPAARAPATAIQAGAKRGPMARDHIGVGGPERLWRLYIMLGGGQQDLSDWRAFTREIYNQHPNLYPGDLIDVLPAITPRNEETRCFVLRWLALPVATLDALIAGVRALPHCADRIGLRDVPGATVSAVETARRAVDAMVGADATRGEKAALYLNDAQRDTVVHLLIEAANSHDPTVRSAAPASRYRYFANDFEVFAQFLGRDDGTSGFTEPEWHEADLLGPANNTYGPAAGVARYLLEQFWLPQNAATVGALRRALHAVGHDALAERLQLNVPLWSRQPAADCAPPSSTAAAVAPTPPLAAPPPAVPSAALTGIGPVPAPMQCLMCRVDRRSMAFVPCGHTDYCDACMPKALLASGGSCPACSQKILLRLRTVWTA